MTEDYFEKQNRKHFKDEDEFDEELRIIYEGIKNNQPLKDYVVELKTELKNNRFLVADAMIARKKIELKLEEESDQISIGDLDITRYSEQYVERSRTIDILNFKLITLLKKQICDVLKLYALYIKAEDETGISENLDQIKKDSEIKLEKNKKSNKLIKRNVKKIAEFIKEYKEKKDAKHKNKNDFYLLKKKIMDLSSTDKSLFNNTTLIFKKITGDDF